MDRKEAVGKFTRLRELVEDRAEVEAEHPWVAKEAAQLVKAHAALDRVRAALMLGMVEASDTWSMESPAAADRRRLQAVARIVDEYFG